MTKRQGNIFREIQKGFERAQSAPQFGKSLREEWEAVYNAGLQGDLRGIADISYLFHMWLRAQDEGLDIPP